MRMVLILRLRRVMLMSVVGECYAGIGESLATFDTGGALAAVALATFVA